MSSQADAFDKDGGFLSRCCTVYIFVVNRGLCYRNKYAAFWMDSKSSRFFLAFKVFYGAFSNTRGTCEPKLVLQSCTGHPQPGHSKLVQLHHTSAESYSSIRC